jgi:hypothetical protein
MYKSDVNLIVAGLVFLVELMIAYYLLYHGIIDGLLKKRIIGDQKGSYLEGKSAVIRGIVFVTIGLVALIIMLMTGWTKPLRGRSLIHAPVEITTFLVFSYSSHTGSATPRCRTDQFTYTGGYNELRHAKRSTFRQILPETSQMSQNSTACGPKP